MISAVKKNDKIVTIGGIRGTVQTVKDETVIVKVDDECRLEFNKSAIASVFGAGVESKKDKKDKKDEKKDSKEEKNKIPEN